jgi:hypothetical protein
MTNFGTEYIGVRTLHHSTSRLAAQAIQAQKVMRPGRSGLFGPAIYFADTQAAARHKCRYHDSSGPQYDVVISVTLNFGKALVLQGTCWKSMNAAQLAQYGCNCVKGRSHAGADWEYVVYHSSLSIP